MGLLGEPEPVAGPVVEDPETVRGVTSLDPLPESSPTIRFAKTRRAPLGSVHDRQTTLAHAAGGVV
jgi:hypothetical protein